MKFSEAIAPAKVILSGEHFVVHGARALAGAINLYLKTRIEESDKDIIRSNGKIIRADYVLEKVKEIAGAKNVKILVRSAVPKSAGLGSSASFHVATIIAAFKLKGTNPSREEIFEESMELERKVHKNPSGIDVWAVLNGGVFIFKKGEKNYSVNSKVKKILLIDSGQRRNTGALVSKVGYMRENEPEKFNELVEIADSISLSMKNALEMGDVEKVKGLFRINQSLLELIDVSTPKIARLLKKLQEYGISAKITGAGGGGYLIGLPIKKVDGLKTKEVKLGVRGAYDINFTHFNN
ncbi:MAG: mevalonate kinase [Nitrososphaeria archaeon]|jgi:mevalonate kinase